MKIAVIGNGYVGTTTGAILAHAGHNVIGLDVDQSKVDVINDGKAPFYEVGLNSLIESAVTAKTLVATTDYKTAIADADVIFSCVGTPDNPDGSSNLDYVFAAASEAAKYIRPEAIYVQKSTVPVGTGRKVQKLLPDNTRYVSNPEFLRESTSIEDTLLFDRVVAGGDDESAIETIFDLYRTIETHADNIAKQAGLDELAQQIADNSGDYVATALESAELIKVSANAFLAMKITFANSIAKLCDQTGADVAEVMAAVGADGRIGKAFLNAGRGFGGGCFPKDVSGLIASATEFNTELPVMNAVMTVNKSMPGYILNKVQEQTGPLYNKDVSVLGLAFKPGTSDARKSPAVAIANRLDSIGAEVVTYDPQASDEAKPDLRTDVKVVDSIDAALRATTVVFVATDWPEFEAPVTKLRNCIVVDCMNSLDRSQFNQSVTYIGVGR